MATLSRGSAKRTCRRKNETGHRTSRRLRAEWLALDGMELLFIHGWLLGVACAIERMTGADPDDVDRLLAELRENQGPDDFLERAQ